jgi:Ca-activated chloride channel family protein
VLAQRFANPHDEPLEVVYSLPLPHDAAVSEYVIVIGERRIVGEVRRREDARAGYEEALLEGRSASLLEQERGSLFTQTVGNVPPGQEIVVEVSIDQPLAWLDQRAWEWRFPTVVAPRYLGAEGRTPDADRIEQHVTDQAGGPQLGLALVVRDALTGDGTPESPSHELDAAREGDAWRVTLAAGSDSALDRDLVVRWPVAAPEPGLTLDVGRAEAAAPHADHAHGALTVVPPIPDGPVPTMPRDMVLLIDTSGSMSGEPLEQAIRVARALVGSLGESDTLEMIEFSSRPHRWRDDPVQADAAARREAIRWLAALSPGGSTEMVRAVKEALRPLRDEAQRQVVLITDGYIGFEGDLVLTIRDGLPAGSRLHAVGVGPATNRSLLGPAARAGRGLEALVGLHESVEDVRDRVLARTVRPVVTDLSIEGDVVEEVAPRALPDLFTGSPVRLALRLSPEGGRLTVRGRTAEGEWSRELEVPPVEPGTGTPAAATLFARERVEDLEVDLAAGSLSSAVDPVIERIGLDHQVATRLTSWVAIDEEPSVDPTRPSRRVRQPHRLPQDLSAEGLGLRPAQCPSPIRGRLAEMPDFEVAHRRLESRWLEGVESMRGAARTSRLADWTEALGAPPPAEPRLVARVRHHGEGRLVLEVLVEDADFDWTAPRHVRLRLADGRRVKVRVEEGGTTGRGSVAPGTVLRLVLELPSHELPIEPVELVLSRGPLGRLHIPIET